MLKQIQILASMAGVMETSKILEWFEHYSASWPEPHKNVLLKESNLRGGAGGGGGNLF